MYLFLLTLQPYFNKIISQLIYPSALNLKGENSWTKRGSKMLSLRGKPEGVCSELFPARTQPCHRFSCCSCCCTQGLVFPLGLRTRLLWRPRVWAAAPLGQGATPAQLARATSAWDPMVSNRTRGTTTSAATTVNVSHYLPSSCLPLCRLPQTRCLTFSTPGFCFCLEF